MVCFRNLALGAVFLAIPAMAQAEDMAPVALNSLSSVPAGAASAAVMDQHNKPLGQAQGIQTDEYGKPSAVAFRTASGNMVVISAAAVSFDGKVLVADNDQPQIAAITSARVAKAN